jgi:hypothetical protein
MLPTFMVDSPTFVSIVKPFALDHIDRGCIADYESSSSLGSLINLNVYKSFSSQLDKATRIRFERFVQGVSQRVFKDHNQIHSCFGDISDSHAELMLIVLMQYYFVK